MLVQRVSPRWILNEENRTCSLDRWLDLQIDNSPLSCDGTTLWLSQKDKKTKKKQSFGDSVFVFRIGFAPQKQSFGSVWALVEKLSSVTVNPWLNNKERLDWMLHWSVGENIHPTQKVQFFLQVFATVFLCRESDLHRKNKSWVQSEQTSKSCRV